MTIMSCAQNVWLVDFRSSSKLFTWGQKLGRKAKLKENVNTLRVYIFFEVIIMNLAQNVLS